MSEKGFLGRSMLDGLALRPERVQKLPQPFVPGLAEMEKVLECDEPRAGGSLRRDQVHVPLKVLDEYLAFLKPALDHSDLIGMLEAEQEVGAGSERVEEESHLGAVGRKGEPARQAGLSLRGQLVLRPLPIRDAYSPGFSDETVPFEPPQDPINGSALGAPPSSSHSVHFLAHGIA